MEKGPHLATHQAEAVRGHAAPLLTVLTGFLTQQRCKDGASTLPTRTVPQSTKILRPRGGQFESLCPQGDSPSTWKAVYLCRMFLLKMTR